MVLHGHDNNACRLGLRVLDNGWIWLIMVVWWWLIMDNNQLLGEEWLWISNEMRFSWELQSPDLSIDQWWVSFSVAEMGCSHFWTPATWIDQPHGYAKWVLWFAYCSGHWNPAVLYPRHHDGKSPEHLDYTQAMTSLLVLNVMKCMLSLLIGTGRVLLLRWF